MKKSINPGFVFLFVFSIILSTCSESDHVRKSSLKVRFNNAWIENFSDQDTDGYGSSADISFEIESNNLVTLAVIVGYRASGTNGEYYFYKQTENFELNGKDVFLTSLGAESEEIAEGCYDFLLQVFDVNNSENILAQVSADNIEALSDICFEDILQDQVVQLELSNPLYTAIDVTIDNSSTGTVQAGESTIFEFNGVQGVVNVYAETAGQTNNGDMIGIPLFWNFSVDLTGLSYASRELYLSSDYLFIYITNTGSKGLTPFYVNYGLADEVQDNILIPNDGVTYSTGYYPVHSNTVVLAFLQGTENYVYWDESVNPFIPWSENQAVHLTSNIASAASMKTPKVTAQPQLPLNQQRQSIKRLWEKGQHPQKIYAKVLIQ